MRLTFSTIVRIRYRDVFRPFHLFSWTDVVLTFKYYTNLRLQIVSFWHVIYLVIILEHRVNFIGLGSILVRH